MRIDEAWFARNPAARYFDGPAERKNWFTGLKEGYDHRTNRWRTFYYGQPFKADLHSCQEELAEIGEVLLPGDFVD